MNLSRHKRFVLCRQFQLFRSDAQQSFQLIPGHTVTTVNKPRKYAIKAMVNANRFLSTIKLTAEYSEELPGDL